jgi:hypothetical protein
MSSTLFFLNDVKVVTIRRGNASIQDYLRACRQEYIERIQRRLQQGIDEGDLDPRCNVETLAAFYHTVMRGLSAQASDGASREALLAIVDVAMNAWKDFP